MPESSSAWHGLYVATIAVGTLLMSAGRLRNSQARVADLLERKIRIDELNGNEDYVRR